jgi:hypothetical protein
MPATPPLRPEDLREGALYEAANGSGETARIERISPEAAYGPRTTHHNIVYVERTKAAITEGRPGRTRTLRAERFIKRYQPVTEAVSSRSPASIPSPQADHIAQILREDRAEQLASGALQAGYTPAQAKALIQTALKETIPVTDTPLHAVIYVGHPQIDLDGSDLYHRTRLRLYALECGYTVDAVITAHDPEDAEHPPVAYQLIRRALKDGDVDVIVLWHRDLDIPDALTRADIIPGFPEPLRDPSRPQTAPHTHTWVTALDGEDQPAVGKDGKPWTHCGICGLPRDTVAPVIPQTLSPLTVGGNQPIYPLTARVRYDDSYGVIKKSRYNGGRDAWDAYVEFENGDKGWCWESDLTPVTPEGE